jgi:octaprenyl-diphosphate synthase
MDFVKYFTKFSTPVGVAANAGAEIKQFLSLIQPRLDAVEAAIHRQAEAFDPAVQGYVSYACQTTGKRLRPALALLTAGATGGISAPHESLAVIMELIHLATLIHDDILDGAEKRRDQPTANSRWGNHISVLLGDCLFAHALDLSTYFEDAEVSRTIARAASAVCTGEILQTQRRFDLNLSLEDYYRIIEMKTAALFAAASELGATLNHAGPKVALAMKTYGLKLGTAYQIYDDLLDLAGDEAAAGKTLGTDLKKGKLTLPILNLLRSAQNGQRERYTAVILQGDAEGLASLRDAARHEGALAEAVAVGCGLIEDADRQLEILPASPYRDALQAIGRRLRGMIDQF